MLVVPTLPGLAKEVGTAMVKAWVAPSPRVEANRQQRAASHEALRRRVQEIGDSLVMREGKPSAKERTA